MKARFDATGDVIVISGGAQGIGAALARATAAAGAQTIVCDIETNAGKALAAEHDLIEFRYLNVADKDAVQSTIAAIEADYGHIDGLILGAAIQPRQPLADMSADTWHSVLDINLNGVLWMYQAGVEKMIARRSGSIITFTSGLAATGWPESGPYAATKAALIAMAKSAAKEIAQYGVRFNLVSPGVIDTVQYREANAGKDHNFWSNTLGVGDAEDVVGSLMFLLSDAAAITASTLSREYAYSAKNLTTEEE